jgi:hypothetical protein
MPRTDIRHPTHAEAKIIFGPAEEMRCTICNLSPGGARLKLPFVEWLPPRFELEDSKGVRRHVMLAWQGSEYIGVRYMDRAPRRRGAQFGRRGLYPTRD